MDEKEINVNKEANNAENNTEDSAESKQETETLIQPNQMNNSDKDGLPVDRGWAWVLLAGEYGFKCVLL